jgi:hypothetical protein
MRFFRPFAPLLRGWGLSFLGWGAIAAVLGAQLVQQDRGDWEEALRLGLRDWLPWAVLTPLIFHLIERLPIEHRNWRIALPVHIGLCVVVVTLCEQWKRPFLDAGSPAAQRQPPPEPPRDFGTRGNLPPPPPGNPPGKILPKQPPHFDLFHYLSYTLPIYLFIASAAHTLLYRRRLAEHTASLARARLEGLRMQLQPHFLFNTLNMISSMITRDPARADKMLLALSDLLRFSLNTSAEFEVPLARELEITERYLEIMHARFDERLRYRISAELETHAALVPPFLLQPLAENSIRHGLGSLPEGGRIEILAHRRDTLLCLTVSDTGVGLLTDFSEGIGLGNTRTRLRELYGERATLVLRNQNGLAVEITLPFHTS